MNTASNIVIKEVTTKADLRRFVDFPNILYKDVPQFVPAFFSDDVDDWDPKKNPAFSYCEGKCFLALRDGEIIGRIGAILSHKANETWNTRRMRFSQVDFIDDKAVSAALFNAVEAWAREKGCDQVHGPLGFCDLDREGMLVEGFDRPGMFITYYNHPYYLNHLTALGYIKDTDWVENLIEIPAEDSAIVQKFHKLSERILRRGHYHKAVINTRRDITPEYIEKAFHLVNEAYAPLYSVVPLTETQIRKYARKFLPILSPQMLSLVFDEQENLVAFGVCVPSMAKALKKCRGRLFPFGWIGLLRAMAHNDTLDMLLIAVRPDLQGSGLNAVVMDHLISGANKLGIRYGETGPTLETNSKVQAQWNYFPHEQHKRRRCFVKDLV